MKRASIVIFLLLFMILFGIGPAVADIYKYRDAEGVIRYTYDLAEVPEDQRPKVKTYEEKPTETEAIPAKENKESEGDSAKESEKEPPVVDENKIEELKKKKKDLDAEFADLMEEKYKLLKEKEKLDTLAGRDAAAVAEYDKKVKELNLKIGDFQKRQDAFQKETQALENAIEKSDETGS